MEAAAEDGMRGGAVTAFLKGLGNAFEDGSKVISMTVSRFQQMRNSVAGQHQPAVLHFSVFLAPSSTININHQNQFSAEWLKFKKNNGCTRCGVSNMKSSHNEVAYNEPPRLALAGGGSGWLSNAPLVGWRFYSASPCELSIRNLRRDKHPTIGGPMPKWVQHQEENSINHGTNWLMQCPPNPTNSKWVDAQRDNRLSHLSFDQLTKIGKQMWRDNKIEKKFFLYGATQWRNGSGPCRPCRRLRLAMDLDRADLVTELLRLCVQAPS
jgi:hypothetical protein